MATGTVVFVIFQNRVMTQYPVFSLNFSSAGKGPFLTSKAKTMWQRCALLAGRGRFAFTKAFIFEHPVNQLTEKYFKHLKTKNLWMKAAFATRVNWVTQVAEVANFPAGQESLELGQRPMKRLLASSALKGTIQHLNKVIREKSCVYFLIFRIYFLFLWGSAWITTCVFFETTYMSLILLTPHLLRR